MQTRQCNDWNCPDCSKSCGSGTLDSQCVHCVCQGDVIAGIVKDVAGKPLSDVSVYNADLPISPLTTTDQDGYFELLDYCADDLSLLFRKDKFVDAEWKSDTTTRRRRDVDGQKFNITLQRLQPPTMLEHPQNKIRLSGQTVTLCCNARAKPPVHDYEWFHNDIILDRDIYNYNNTLTLNGLTTTDGGIYTCRANGETGSQYSLPATLTVLDSMDMACSATPEQHLLKLPEGCQGNSNAGPNYHDIGKCAQTKCPLSTVDGSVCTDAQEQCCSPVSYETQDIACDTFNISVQVVSSCGCANCGKGTITVRGRASGLDEVPLPLGELYMEGELLTTTSAAGDFTFEVVKGKKRLAVTFRDKFNLFVSVTKILTIGDDTSIFHQVYLQRLPSPVTIDASDVSVIPLGGQSANESSVAELEIPAEAFRNEDGTLYTGDVKATLAFSDPADSSAFNLLSGELSTRDVEGNPQALKTYGMFSMDFQDDSGNPLRLDAPMKLYLDVEVANVDVSSLDDEANPRPHLWFLNEVSGEWEDIGGLEVVQEKRKKRQTETFLVGNIEVVGYNLNRLPYCNIDRIETWRRHCYLKVRAYGDESMEQPLAGVQVTALTNDLVERDRVANQYDGRLSFFQKTTTGQDGSACLWTFCARDDSLFSVNVRAEGGVDVLSPVHPDSVPDNKHPGEWPEDLLQTFTLPEPADESGFMTMRALTPQMAFEYPWYDRYYDQYDYERYDDRDLGPFYWLWHYTYGARSTCMNADQADNHLVFVKKDKGLEEVEFEDYDFDDPTHLERDRTEMSWFPYEGDQKRACFIKILVDSVSSERFIMKSKGGDHPAVKDQEYGLRIDNSKPNPPVPALSSKTAACIEFKCSGSIRRGHPEINIPAIGEIVGSPDTTLLEIAPTSGSSSCRLKAGDDGVNPGLVSFVTANGLASSIDDDNPTYAFKVPAGNVNGPNTGVYVGQGPGRDCYDIGYHNCMSGDDNGYAQSSPDNPDVGWALQYECP
ncbi:cartilage intermediate layer protein 1-like [Ptychodera flava]|uniref:cartilage intermediate layer protein 1-like n=1 Tax=Ptychodera flava TaxID=63121 RepID=UPI003969D3EE